jgi:hypothetical protein
MTVPLPDLLAEARQAGLTLERDGDMLRVRGPRAAGPLARTLLARKVEVLAALDGPAASEVEPSPADDDDQGDVDPVEEPAEELGEEPAAAAEFEPADAPAGAGAGGDVAMWLWGGAVVAGLACLVWAVRGQRRAPSSPATEAGRPYEGLALEFPGSPF